jgi:hypothetical protein
MLKATDIYQVYSRIIYQTTNMKTYKQIEQRIENEWLENKAMLYSDNPEIMVMGFIKEHLKQALLNFYEEVVPERKENKKSRNYSEDIDDLLVDTYNEAIDDTDLNKQRYFEE